MSRSRSRASTTRSRSTSGSSSSSSADARGATVAPRYGSRDGRTVVKNPRWRSRAGLFWLLAALGLVFAVTPVIAGSTTSNGKSSERALKDAGEGTFDVLEQANQYGEAR